MTEQEVDELDNNLLQRIIDAITMHGEIHQTSDDFRASLVFSTYNAAQNSGALSWMPYETIKSYVHAYCDAKDVEIGANG